MADKALTLDQINKVFQSVIMAALGLSTEAVGNYYFVRVDWPTGGAPGWKVGEDVAFLRCVEQDGPYNKQRDVSYQVAEPNLTQSTDYTRIWSLPVTFYGPNSFDNCRKVKSYLFQQSTHDILAMSGLYMTPDVSAGKRAPEMFQGQWWERVDIEFTFYEAVHEETVMPYLESATVTVANGQTTADISVSQ